MQVWGLTGSNQPRANSPTWQSYHKTGVASDQSNDVVFPNCGSIQSCKCCSSKVYAVG